ncbi:MAG: hypothetical protein BWY09_02211 [Candidatus Hydrogenedentes bacterium ADurb.Bin179]|nr:MAG: hypothetical protein BWY09_02211 [Candidatus Hydrogenedentes bacterium ADurb.Bin179]
MQRIYIFRDQMRFLLLEMPYSLGNNVLDKRAPYLWVKGIPLFRILKIFAYQG